MNHSDRVGINATIVSSKRCRNVPIVVFPSALVLLGILNSKGESIEITSNVNTVIKLITGTSPTLFMALFKIAFNTAAALPDSAQPTRILPEWFQEFIEFNAQFF